MANEAVQAIYAQDIVSTFDIHEPQVLNTLFARHGDQGLSMYRIIESMGFKMPVAGDNYFHFEENWKIETIHSLVGVADPGAGNNALITLSPGDLDSQNRFYPRQWFTIQFHNETIGTIVAINIAVPGAPVLTVRPNDLTKTIGAIAAGEELWIAAPNFAEGSEQPASVFSGTYKYTNDTQILKERVTATGTEMTEEPRFEKLLLPDGTGKEIVAYYIKGQYDAEFRMDSQIDDAILFHQRVTNSFVGFIDPTSSSASAPKATEGLVPGVTRLGRTVGYNVGLFGIPKFDQIERLLNKEFSGEYVCCFNGLHLMQEVKNTLVDYFKDTNINYITERANKSMFGGDGGLGASVNYSYLTTGKYTYAFKELGSFSHSKKAGVDGYKTPGIGIWIPMQKKKDKLTREAIPSFGVRYRQRGPYNRMMEVWPISGAGPFTKVISQDVHNMNWRTHIGFHGIALNQAIKLVPN